MNPGFSTGILVGKILPTTYPPKLIPHNHLKTSQKHPISTPMMLINIPIEFGFDWSLDSRDKYFWVFANFFPILIF